MHDLPLLRLGLTFLLSLSLLVSQVISGPLEVLPLATPPPTKQLHKRGVLEDLWNSVSNPNKVNTGTAKSWMLYPDKGDKAAVFAPTEFYGCTLVVIVNGHGVVIGHFAQEKPGDIKCMQDQASVNSMIDKLETAEAEVDVDNVADTRAWIIYSDDTSQTSPGYKAIFSNLNDKNVMNIPEGNIKPITYRRGGGGGNTDKLVVQWQPNSDNSGATLTVYIRSDTAAFTGNYDCNGNPVTGGARLMARVGPVCTRSIVSTISVIPIPATPLCTYVAPEPPVITKAFCSCSSASYALSSVPGTPVAVSSSCGYTALPTATESGINGAPPITYSGSCQVCTPYAANGADCTSIPSCTPTPTA
ncbi:MAG: hypothetical protein LQ343_005555 [Gyalolechia ehrenbergii]|nr:MAG: hypothetical protein LQ343_005555 [Gyalolechia ehrenbergii]